MRWIDNTYESLLAGGKVKEDVLWIITWIISSIIEDYLSPSRSTDAKTSFDSYSRRQSTLIWEVIKVHLAAKKMLENPSSIISLLFELTPNGLLVTREENKPWTPRLWLLS